MVNYISDEELLGIEHNHLQDFCGVQVHQGLITALLELTQQAEAQGFEFAIASGYRSFERQLVIWNDKAAGRRAVLNDDGSVLDVFQLTERERVFAILRWSALPGASRHHWGADIDVYDKLPSQNGYKLQLTVEETLEGGVFAEFYSWLDQVLASQTTGFFRPYTQSLGGVAPEPWHLSYQPISSLYQARLSKDAILNLIKTKDIALKSLIIDHFDEIYDRFILT